MLAGVRAPALLAALLLACTLRGDGERVADTRELPPFAEIEVFDLFAVTVTVDPDLPADEPVEVTVTGDGNALGRLFTLVHGEQILSVGVDPNELTTLSMTPEVEASVPALTRAYAADATTLEVVAPRGELTVTVLESAELAVSDAEQLTLHATVQGDAALLVAGAGPLLELVVEDGATVDARRFYAEKVVVRARGDGEVAVCATAEFTVLGAGASRVTLACG